jgi:hypothetical protein
VNSGVMGALSEPFSGRSVALICMVPFAVNVIARTFSPVAGLVRQF